MLMLMVVFGFVLMLLYMKKENDNSVPGLVGTCVFGLGIILLFVVLGASAWVASAGIEELEEENQIIYELIEPRLTSTDDEYFNETEQLFWNSQVERYISNQQIIAEKKEDQSLLGMIRFLIFFF